MQLLEWGLPVRLPGCPLSSSPPCPPCCPVGTCSSRTFQASCLLWAFAHAVPFGVPSPPFPHPLFLCLETYSVESGPATDVTRALALSQAACPSWNAPSTQPRLPVDQAGSLVTIEVHPEGTASV